MAKKQLSFAEKAAKKKKRGFKSVKFIKSFRSEKTGHWRFKERIFNLIGGESIDAALERQEKEVHALDIEMPVAETEPAEVETTSQEEVQEEAVAEEVQDAEAVPVEEEETQAEPEAEEVQPKEDTQEEETEPAEVEEGSSKPEPEGVSEAPVDEKEETQEEVDAEG